MLDKSLYTTVLCQTFSPCGKYLVAGSSYGQIAVFDIEKALNPSFDRGETSCNKAKYIFMVEKYHKNSAGSNTPITALASSNNYLIIGTNGEISGWDWKALPSLTSGEPSWGFKIPSKTDLINVADVNCLWVDTDNEQLIAGCGDNNLYSFSLETGKLLRTYEGHNDYIHDVHGLGNQLVSCGEDGLLKVWDSRDKTAHATLEPYKNSKIARNDLGKWLGAVALSSDWIVCGGGPRASLWHLRAMEATTVFDLPDNGIHVTLFHEESLVIAGASRHLYQVNYSGDVMVNLPVSSTTVYSAVWRTSPHQVFTVAGSSQDIDLCTTLNYRDMVLHFKT